MLEPWPTSASGSTVSVVRGQASHEKVVRLEGVAEDELRARLATN
jgi:uncharacterized protein YggU (UPF0235/DUF167 family)